MKLPSRYPSMRIFMTFTETASYSPRCSLTHFLTHTECFITGWMNEQRLTLKEPVISLVSFISTFQDTVSVKTSYVFFLDQGSLERWAPFQLNKHALVQPSPITAFYFLSFSLCTQCCFIQILVAGCLSYFLCNNYIITVLMNSVLLMCRVGQCGLGFGEG